MKFLLFILMTPSICFGDSSSENKVVIKDSLKDGECFEYKDFENDNKFKWVVGRVDSLNLRTFNYHGILYAKLNDNKKDSFVAYKFEMKYGKQFKYKKVSCPKSLPKWYKK